MPQGAFRVAGNPHPQIGNGGEAGRTRVGEMAPDTHRQHANRTDAVGRMAGRPGEGRIGGREHQGTWGVKTRVRESAIAGSVRSRAASRAVRTT
jgi:hypothetical protein